MLKIEGAHKANGNTIHRVVGDGGQKVGHITQTSWGFVPVRYRKFRLDQLLSRPSLAEALEALRKEVTMEKVYFYRGQVQRWSSRFKRYTWLDGYSPNSPDGNPIYPWVTGDEARQEGKQGGFRPKFVRNSHECLRCHVTNS